VSQERSRDIRGFLTAWRTTELRDRQVIDGLVHPDHAAPSPLLAAALRDWPGSWYWAEEADGRHIVLTRQRGRRAERWVLHVLLLVLTLCTTTWAGAVFAGTLPPPGPFDLAFHLRGAEVLDAVTAGLRFSLPLVAVLLAHELGHYLTARRYDIDASPPYFLPTPLWPFFIGTMGAFIRLRTVVADRRQLLDVGVAGPLAGFVLALPALGLGLARSEPVPAAVGLHGMVIWLGAIPRELGDSLLTLGLRAWLAPGAEAVALDPLAFAGWIGMVVTMLNLLPIGQLDGGHILYAAAPRWHRAAAGTFFLALLVLGWHAWLGWMVWAALVFAFSRGRLAHPSVLDVVRPVPAGRRALAWLALVVFIATFVVVPFRL
jgi:Zn-dependent protease